MEPPPIIEYWNQVIAAVPAHPTFQNYFTLSFGLSSRVCCLYIVAQRQGIAVETLVLVGQDHLDTIVEFIHVEGGQPIAKTSHIKTFEIYRSNTPNDDVSFIIGFYFDSINGTYNSCVNGAVNNFTDRTVQPLIVDQLRSHVIPGIRRSLESENIAIRCNGQTRDNKRCKKLKKGSFYCSKHM